MKKKKVLLAAPYHFDLYTLIEKNLCHVGYDVTTIVSEEFRYDSFLQRISNFIMKTTRIDKHYKNKLKSKSQISKWGEIISSNANYDYALFIRADLFMPELLVKVREVSTKMVAYQYDGIERYPQIKNTIKFFDDFFVFDPLDFKNKEHKYRPTTNFYFDYKEDSQNAETDDCIYFLGSYHKERMITLFNLEKLCKKINARTNINIVSHTHSNNNSEINFIKTPFSFQEYLSQVQKSAVIVDIVTDYHIGLSFRIFESIKYKKKIITTNEYVASFDFYHPNNIFVLRKDTNHEELDSFLKKPFFEISENIRHKYSFSNWINYIFGIHPHSEIFIPGFVKNK